jgi:flagellar hook-associated protein 2
LSNIVDGLTLNLANVTTDPVTVNVVTDTDALKKTISDFAAAVHRRRQADRHRHEIRRSDQDRRHPPGRQRGGRHPAQLRTLAGSLSAASSTFGHLSDIGLSCKRTAR